MAVHIAGTHRRPHVRIILHIQFEKRTPQRVEGGLGLGRADTRLESREYIQPLEVAILQFAAGGKHLRTHHHRHEDLWRLGGADTAESRLHYANDGHGLAVEQKGLVQDAGIAAESSLPIIVTKHHDRARAWDA